MRPVNIPRGSSSDDDDMMASPPQSRATPSSSSSSAAPNPFSTLITSASRPYPQAHQAVPPPLRFPSTLGAFNLAASSNPQPPASPQRSPEQQMLEASYPLHACNNGNGKLRRPSMLSMAQTRPTSFGSTCSTEDQQDIADPSSSKSPFLTQPQPRWATHLSPSPSIRRVSSAPPPIDSLTTSTPPPRTDNSGGSSPVGMEMDGSTSGSGIDSTSETPISKLWKGKGKMRELPVSSSCIIALTTGSSASCASLGYTHLGI
jgi:hypothetical protein